MRAVTRSLATTLLCLAAIALAGCAKPKPAEQAPAPTPPPAPVEFKVLGLELGSQIGPDKRVLTSSTTFGAKDTIYVSIATEGASASAALSVRWTYGDGQLVNEMSETIAPTGPAATEFHISKTGGWPVGKYKVEVAANGAAAGMKEFEVK